MIKYALIALYLIGGAGLVAPNAWSQIEDENTEATAADAIPPGQELVNMDFPELTDIRDIIKAVSLWTGKNVILDRNANGKVQIISPRRMTKEEAYQAFLSSLNVLGLTTVETGKVIKVLPIRTAMKGNLKTFMGSNWTPRTDEIITQIVPLKYVDAKKIQSTLSRIISSNAMIAYEPTNTLIISDSGYKIRRVLDILELIDVQTQQPKVAIVPIKNADAKSIADKVKEIFQASSGKSKKGSSYHSYKIFTDERTNSVIIFGPPRTIKDVKVLVKKFDVPIEDPTRQSSIHVRPLEYADAKKLAATLSSLASGGKSKTSSIRRPPSRSKKSTSAAADVADLGDGVKITADESSNSLIITGSRAAYDTLNSIVKKLDIRRSQVFVETDIMDINLANNFNFGTSIFAGHANGEKSTKFITTWEARDMAPLIESSLSTDATTGAASTGAAAKVAGSFASDMVVGVLAGDSVDVPGLGSFTPGALIKMIKTDENTKILSSPHILTANNEEANITVGEKIFFASSETNAATGVALPKIEKEDIDLSLTVKPNVSFAGNVTLNIELEASSLAGIDPTTKTPRINSRKTKQIVTVRNGQTVVVSGLVRNSEFESFKKIPLLGDIPILGWLFRNSTIAKSQSNLVIFLTPHVVHGPDDLASIYKTKIKERDEFLEKIYGKSGIEGDFYASLPNLKDGEYTPTAIDAMEKKRINDLRNQVFHDMGYSGSIEDGNEEPVDMGDDVSVPVFPDEGGSVTTPSEPAPAGENN